MAFLLRPNWSLGWWNSYNWGMYHEISTGDRKKVIVFKFSLVNSWGVLVMRVGISFTSLRPADPYQKNCPECIASVYDIYSEDCAVNVRKAKDLINSADCPVHEEFPMRIRSQFNCLTTMQESLSWSRIPLWRPGLNTPGNFCNYYSFCHPETHICTEPYPPGHSCSSLIPNQCRLDMITWTVHLALKGCVEQNTYRRDDMD